jgi:hypothetical protein
MSFTNTALVGGGGAVTDESLLQEAMIKTADMVMTSF